MTRSFSLLAQLAAQGPLAEVKPMSAPAIRGLAATIRNATTRINDTAGKLAQALDAEAAAFEGDAGDVMAQLGDVKAARADLRSALGLGGNGGPPLDGAAPTLAPASQPAPAQSPTSGDGSPTTEITAIGPIQR